MERAAFGEKNDFWSNCFINCCEFVIFAGHRYITEWSLNSHYFEAISSTELFVLIIGRREIIFYEFLVEHKNVIFYILFLVY